MLNEFKNDINKSNKKLLTKQNKIMKKQLRKAKIYFNRNFEDK
jgi:hypothetical protein